MAKLLLISILAVTIVVPSLAARASNPVRGFKKLIVQMFTLTIVYWLVAMLFMPAV
jgi:hypothetical protein